MKHGEMFPGGDTYLLK